MKKERKNTRNRYNGIVVIIFLLTSLSALLELPPYLLYFLEMQAVLTKQKLYLRHFLILFLNLKDNKYCLWLLCKSLYFRLSFGSFGSKDLFHFRFFFRVSVLQERSFTSVFTILFFFKKSQHIDILLLLHLLNSLFNFLLRCTIRNRYWLIFCVSRTNATSLTVCMPLCINNL